MLFDKKAKYKKLAKKYKDDLASREQELTDLIVENNERRHQFERLAKESKGDGERLRSEVAGLMEDNHRYQRDLERLTRENELMRTEIIELGNQSEFEKSDLQRILEERSQEADNLH